MDRNRDRDTTRPILRRRVEEGKNGMVPEQTAAAESLKGIGLRNQNRGEENNARKRVS